MNKAPIFIVGMNGSGTTMLADSLGHHPHLYMLPHESKVLPYHLQHQGRFGDLNTLAARRKFSDTLGRAKPYWQSNGKKNVVLQNEELNDPGFAGVVNALYHHLAKRHGKVRWGDKSPINTQHISALAVAFPDAQFIHIIRDGRDAAQSFHRRWGYAPLHTMIRWKRVISEGRRQGVVLGSDRYMEVTYEEFTAHPEYVMRQVCTFLDIDFHDGVLNSSMCYVDTSHELAGTGRIIVNSGKWCSYFTSRQIADMEMIAGDLLFSLGYSAMRHGNVDPHPIWLCYWRIYDGLRFVYWFFSEYGLGALPMFMRHVNVAVRQWASAKH